MAGILSIGTSALLSFQRSLTTTGHNIANSDTEGYSRQRVQLATQLPSMTGVGWMGSGVRPVAIDRLYDDFLSTQVRTSQSSASELEAYFDHASRIDNILSDPNNGLNPAIQDFFDSMQVLADNPSSVPTRQLLLSETTSMVDRFHDLSRQFTDARSELNQEMSAKAAEISGLGSALAQVNQAIVTAIATSGGDEPNDLLDQREVLLSDLSKIVNVNTVPQDNGAWNVFMGNGLALVIGTTASAVTTQLSASDVSELDIAFTNTFGTQAITSQITGGELGGLLTYRDQILDPGQNQLGLVAAGLSDRINIQHQLGLDLDGNFGGQVFNAPTVSVVSNTENTSVAAITAQFVDTGNITASDYRVERVTGANAYTVTRISDNQSTNITLAPAATSAEIDGFTFSISSLADVGDKFLIRPTRNVAESLSLQINTAREFAAAGPVRATPGTNIGGSPNQGSGVITQPSVTTTTGLPLAGPATISLQWSPTANAGTPGFAVTGGPGGTIAYDPATQSAGATFTFAGSGGMSFTISGTPESGDRFVIENNTAGVGDNRNALLMADLQNQNTVLGQTATLFGPAGGATETATFQEAYGQMVSDVGAKTHQAEVNYEATDKLRERHKNSLLSVSGVNLDEEAANLIKFQQAYQAAAQVISVSSTLFDTLIGAVRR